MVTLNQMHQKGVVLRTLSFMDTQKKTTQNQPDRACSVDVRFD